MAVMISRPLRLALGFKLGPVTDLGHIVLSP